MTLDCPRTKSTVHLPDNIVTSEIHVITMNEGKDIWVRTNERDWLYIEQCNILRLA